MYEDTDFIKSCKSKANEFHNKVFANRVLIIIKRILRIEIIELEA